MKIRAVYLLMLFLTTSLTSCTKKDDQSQQLSSTGFSTEIVSRLDSALDNIMANDSLPGLAGCIWIEGEGEWTFARGFSDVETQTPRNETDVFRIGSITKTFLATVFLQLCDEGKTALNDKLEKYYPDFPNANIVTMRTMLNMTSGLRDYLGDPAVFNAFFFDRTKKFTDEELYDIAIKLSPLFQPGAPGKWDYSNTNYLLLGMIIKKVTGNSWQQEISNRIINKLQLKNTIVPTSTGFPEQYCHGYMKDSASGKLIDVSVQDPSISTSAGNMISNINDLKIWSKALSEGKPLSDSMQAERLKIVPASGLLKYGLGLMNLGSFTGHSGQITGYNTDMYYSTELKAMFIVSVNRYELDKGKADEIFAKLSLIVLGDKVPWYK